MFVYLIDKQLKACRSLTSDEMFSFFAKEMPLLRGKPPQMITIDTKSNLWPNLLQDILVRLELESYVIIEDTRKLATLVSRRNDIAHGKKVFIDDVTYYLEYEVAVSNVMYAMALAVVDKYSKVEPKEAA